MSLIILIRMLYQSIVYWRNNYCEKQGKFTCNLLHFDRKKDVMNTKKLYDSILQGVSQMLITVTFHQTAFQPNVLTVHKNNFITYIYKEIIVASLVILYINKLWFWYV